MCTSFGIVDKTNLFNLSCVQEKNYFLWLSKFSLWVYLIGNFYKPGSLKTFELACKAFKVSLLFSVYFTLLITCVIELKTLCAKKVHPNKKNLFYLRTSPVGSRVFWNTIWMVPCNEGKVLVFSCSYKLLEIFYKWIWLLVLSRKQQTYWAEKQNRRLNSQKSLEYVRRSVAQSRHHYAVTVYCSCFFNLCLSLINAHVCKLLLSCWRMLTFWSRFMIRFW